MRFYTGPSYARRLAALGVPHLPFRRATEVNGDNLAEHFPEVGELKGPKRIAFDLEKVFFGEHRGPLRRHPRDPRGVPVRQPSCPTARSTRPTSSPRSSACPVFGIGPAPTPAPTSPDGAAAVLRPHAGDAARSAGSSTASFDAMVESTTKPGMRTFNGLLARRGTAAVRAQRVRPARGTPRPLFFKTGVPGMDFPRSDWPANHQFVGPLVPPRTKRATALPFADKLDRYAVGGRRLAGHRRQPRPREALRARARRALGGGRHLVVATTGGQNTDALRARFPQDNVVIEDWVDFDALLPRADLFICNGGYGSIMQALMNGVPLLSAGKLEAQERHQRAARLPRLRRRPQDRAAEGPNRSRRGHSVCSADDRNQAERRGHLRI